MMIVWSKVVAVEEHSFDPHEQKFHAAIYFEGGAEPIMTDLWFDDVVNSVRALRNGLPAPSVDELIQKDLAKDYLLVREQLEKVTKQLEEVTKERDEELRKSRDPSEDVKDWPLPASIRVRLLFGKYTKCWANLTIDQLTGLLWLVGEFAIRDGGNRDIQSLSPGGERRHAVALNGIAQFRHKPMTMDEVRAYMTHENGLPPKEVVGKLMKEMEKRFGHLWTTLPRETCFDELCKTRSYDKALENLSRQALMALGEKP